MSRRYWERSIKDIENDGCSKAEENILLGIFMSSMATIATTLAHKAWYNLDDFQAAQGLEGFALTMTRLDRKKDQDVWNGVFMADGKRLEVTGFLEKIPEDRQYTS